MTITTAFLVFGILTSGALGVPAFKSAANSLSETGSLLQAQDPIPISNCGCLLARGQRAASHTTIEPSTNPNGPDAICHNFCGRNSASHFTITSKGECVCYQQPRNVIDCEEFEARDASVVLLKCVNRRLIGVQPVPTKRSTVSQSVLSFLRNANFPTTENQDRAQYDDRAQFLAEVQRSSRHIDTSEPKIDKTKVLNSISTPQPDAIAKATFGPARSAALAATLTLLAFACIFSMGLKTWYNHKRRLQKEQKARDLSENSSEIETVSKKVSIDFDWERIMSK